MKLNPKRKIRLTIWYSSILIWEWSRHR